MEHYKVWLSVIATIIGGSWVCAIPNWYMEGTIKPSAASWMVWGILTAIAFAGQLTSGGGIGTLATGISALASFVVMGLALRNKDSRRLTRLDWACLAASGVAVAMWPIAHSPFLSVLLVSIVTLVGFVPTYMKSFRHPEHETINLYLIGIIKFALSAFTLSQYSAATLLYPITIGVANIGLIALLAVRRKQLAAIQDGTEVTPETTSQEALSVA